MAITHLPRRRRTLLGGVILVACLYWLFQQHEQLKGQLITSAVDKSCLEALARLEQRSDTWPSTLRTGGRIGDDVVESLLDLRDFERCALFYKGLNSDRLRTIEQRLFPYLNFDLLYTDEKQFWPVYSGPNGESVKGSTPKFSIDDNKFLGFSKIKYDQNLSFWGNWLKNVMRPDSRGIVISAGVRQLDDCVRLIRVLRHLGNRLPIEIVHRGDISLDQQNIVFQASIEEVSRHYPLQKLWFLDVSSVLNPANVEHFTTFSNKWLAVIFSTFQNPVLLDADTIPFTSLEIYYDLPQFKTTGAVFFKDRKVVSDLLNEDQLSSLRRIFSTLLDIAFIENESGEGMRRKIDGVIDDELAAETLHNMIFKGQKHHLESGLVLIDKQRHMSDLLASVALQFSSIGDYFHGDKEWFWIAQALQRRIFTFHPKEASNVGKLGRIISDEKVEFYQLCSVQLSHTDVDGSLLWVNGGLRTCKKDSWASDFKENKRIASMFESEDAVRAYYQSPVQLEGAIIPDVNLKPWIMTGECAMFSYCTLYKEGAFGEIIKFSDTQKESYGEIVKIWNSIA